MAWYTYNQEVDTMPSILSGRTGRMAILTDERRMIMAIWLDLGGGLANRIEQIARDIAGWRRHAPRSVQDYVVAHGGHRNSPYDNEIIVIVENNEPSRDPTGFQHLVQLIRERLHANFSIEEYPEHDPVRDPYSTLHDSNHNGWEIIRP